jgi:membrane peptidoglycan carboxypeptidase
VKSGAVQIENLRREWDSVRRTHPAWLGVFIGTAASLLVCSSLRHGSWSARRTCRRRGASPDQRDGPATAVFDRDDHLAFTIFKDSASTPLSEVRRTENAILAIEDQRFYEHNGFDMIRIGPPLANIRRGAAQGGSTITRSSPARAFSRQTYRRKVRS